MTNSKYKIGDRVLVKEDLLADAEYGSLLFVSEMEKYRGTIVTISDIHDLGIDDGYGYFIEGCTDWHWCNQMFARKYIEYKLTDEEVSEVINTSDIFLDLMR